MEILTSLVPPPWKIPFFILNLSPSLLRLNRCAILKYTDAFKNAFIAIILELQIPSVEFHITDFLQDNLLHLVAVLLLLVPASLLRLVGADQPVLHNAYWLQGLLLTLVTDLPGLFLAVLRVAVLLGLLRASLHLQLADLLGLEVAVLLLHRKGEDIGELLAVPVHVNIASLYLVLPGDVVSILCWHSYDCLGDLLSKENLGSLLHVGQDLGADLLGAKSLGSLASILLLVGFGRLLV